MKSSWEPNDDDGRVGLSILFAVVGMSWLLVLIAFIYFVARVVGG